MNTKLSLMGFDIDTSIGVLGFNKNNQIVNTINPHSYCVAKTDSLFRKALANSDVLIPDGIGIVWAAKVIKKERIQRITGADLHEFLLNKLGKTGGKVFYLGSSQSTLNKIKERMNSEHPNINIEVYSPPYKKEFTKVENKKMIEAVNNFQPDVLFVGMTAPKQEKWTYQNQDLLDANVIASIGAVFDFYANTAKRAPKWMQKLGLEWLHRFFSNPKKLWKRVFVSTPIFLFDVFKYKFFFK
ncbi:glycosyl transferase, WecB/TagA/CpsF family [Flexistipes sinusarabici DSM 4947]|uniref:Glycosyl transferase, WecB/TagA/CpsF family n=1 Tax=Flexistipes sinusarabici (strain ATCC 49648 / DSM 4947 / MAS 10) TaxID=717231 RepID=F8E8I9_FLESM|nr:WecB/TagA/CpsF family glycosyltransferase [Flexistipes sinusarabici]AEI14038.1 glycosyl transferase, WecB/TagA/CpsF family [Flexistipes sinusarabici DSM 4947]